MSRPGDVLLLATLLLGSASVSNAELTVFLNERSKFVVRGNGEEILGASFLSPSGSLVPADDPAPFEFFLMNTPNQISYGLLGTTVTINGEVEFSAGWDPFGELDVEYSVGGTVGSLPDEAYHTSRFVRLSLDEESKFVLTGTGQGQRLQSFELQSASGSLLPGETPMPFAQFGANTSNQILMSSPGNHVTLDGSVTLSSGWSREVAVRDVSYEYQLESGFVGRFDLPSSAYPPMPPASRISVKVGDGDRFVLTGTGQQLSGLDFHSPSGSLLPGDMAAPFVQFSANTPNYVSLESPGSRVTIDGTITLSAGWTRDVAGTDVTYEYKQDLLPRIQGPFALPVSAYPELPPNTRLNVTLGDESRFILHGDGHNLTSIYLESPSGSLVPAETASPFAMLESNTTHHIALSSLGNAVTIRGSVGLTAGWNVVGEKDVTYQYGLDGAARPEGPFSLSDPDYPGPPPVKVTLSEDDFRFVLHGQGTGLLGIDFRSPSGSIDPGNNAAPFAFFLGEGNPEQVAMGVLGTSITIDGSAKLDTGWNFLSGQRDVIFWLAIPGESRPIGPFQLPDSYYARSDGTVSEVFVDDSGDLFLSEFDVSVKSLRVLSPGGWLRAVDDPTPFSLVETNTPNEIVLISEEGVATTELLQLPIAWAVEGEQDLVIAMETLTAELGPFVLPPSAYARVPEPSIGCLLSLAGLVVLFARPRRNRPPERA